MGGSGGEEVEVEVEGGRMRLVTEGEADEGRFCDDDDEDDDEEEEIEL